MVFVSNVLFGIQQARCIQVRAGLSSNLCGEISSLVNKYTPVKLYIL